MRRHVEGLHTSQLLAEVREKCGMQAEPDLRLIDGDSPLGSAENSHAEGAENNKRRSLSIKNPASSDGGPQKKLEEDKDNSVEEVMTAIVEKDARKVSPMKKPSAGKLQQKQPTPIKSDVTMLSLQPRSSSVVSAQNRLEISE